MQTSQKSAKSMTTHGFSQFELTDKLLKNVYKLGLKGVTKDVLIQLSTFYNPKNRTMFPKQKTLAQRVNASERSVIRAVQSLIKAGLILVECKHTNHYVFTPKLYCELGLDEKIFNSAKLSYEKGKNITLSCDKISSHVIKQTKEHEKKQTTKKKVVVSFKNSSSKKSVTLEDVPQIIKDKKHIDDHCAYWASLSAEVKEGYLQDQKKLEEKQKQKEIIIKKQREIEKKEKEEYEKAKNEPHITKTYNKDEAFALCVKQGAPALRGLLLNNSMIGRLVKQYSFDVNEIIAEWEKQYKI